MSVNKKFVLDTKIDELCKTVLNNKLNNNRTFIRVDYTKDEQKITLFWEIYDCIRENEEFNSREYILLLQNGRLTDVKLKGSRPIDEYNLRCLKGATITNIEDSTQTEFKNNPLNLGLDTPMCTIMGGRGRRTRSSRKRKTNKKRKHRKTRR